MSLRGGVTLLAPVILLTASAGASLRAQVRPDALQMYREGRYSDAIATTLAELEEDPRNMDAYTVLGWSLLAVDRNEEAVAYGLRALQVARFDHRILHVMGEAYFRLGEDLEALRLYQDYLSVSPQGNLVPQVYRNLGEILIRLGEYNRADIALSTAVHHNGANAEWWTRLGFAREQAGELGPAREAYERALELNAGNTEAQQGLARVE